MNGGDNQIKEDNPNDYAVAYSLNELVREILIIVVIAKMYDVHTKINVDDINRNYVLLVVELSKIYDQNAELSAIKSEPIWRSIDRIKSSVDKIHEHIYSHGTTEMADHCADVEKLSIIAGSKEPEYTPELRELVDHTISAKKRLLEDIEKAMDEKQQSESPKIVGKYIFEYTMKYKPDGTILINNVLKLKKVHAGSITERLLEQALKNPNTPFKPNLGKTARNVSTIISSAGFTPTLREIFFPTVSGDTVVFRPFLSREQADIENIDTEKLDLQLMELGAMAILVRE